MEGNKTRLRFRKIYQSYHYSVSLKPNLSLLLNLRERKYAIF